MSGELEPWQNRNSWYKMKKKKGIDLKSRFYIRIHSLPSGGNPRFRDEEWKKAFEDQNLFSLPLGEQTIK
jgi:hypothetical protein